MSYYEGLQTYPLEKCVRLMNPLSNDLAVLRQTLVFGGLESLAHNINRKKADLMMYEFGHVYSRDPEKESSEAEPLRPFKEETNLGLWMTGDVCAGKLGFAGTENNCLRLEIGSREYFCAYWLVDAGTVGRTDIRRTV